MTINREAWRKVAKAANDLNIARRLAGSPICGGIDAPARRTFKLAMDEAPPVVKFKGGNDDWATLEVCGVKQSMVGPILEALGADPIAIAKAVDDPSLAWDLLTELGAKYRAERIQK